MQKLLSEFHRLVPEVTVVAIPQEKKPALFGVHGAQVEQQSWKAMTTALDSLAEMWPTATGGLPAPHRASTWWVQESSWTDAVIAVASARHTGMAPGKVGRVAAAEAALVADGWAVQRRDPRPPRHLRLVARRGRTLVEVSSWTRPDAYQVEVRHGPVLVGRYGSDLVAGEVTKVDFPKGVP